MNKHHIRNFTRSEREELEKMVVEKSKGYYEYKLDEGKEESLIPVEAAKAILENDCIWAYKIHELAAFYNVDDFFDDITEILQASLKENGGDYDKHSWQKVPNPKQRYWDAYRRHEKKGGSNIDDKS